MLARLSSVFFGSSASPEEEAQTAAAAAEKKAKKPLKKKKKIARKIPQEEQEVEFVPAVAPVEVTTPSPPPPPKLDFLTAAFAVNANGEKISTLPLQQLQQEVVRAGGDPIGLSQEDLVRNLVSRAAATGEQPPVDQIKQRLVEMEERGAVLRQSQYDRIVALLRSRVVEEDRPLLLATSVAGKRAVLAPMDNAKRTRLDFASPNRDQSSPTNASAAHAAVAPRSILKPLKRVRAQEDDGLPDADDVAQRILATLHAPVTQPWQATPLLQQARAPPTPLPKTAGLKFPPKSTLPAAVAPVTFKSTTSSTPVQQKPTTTSGSSSAVQTFKFSPGRHLKQDTGLLTSAGKIDFSFDDKVQWQCNACGGVTSQSFSTCSVCFVKRGEEKSTSLSKPLAPAIAPVTVTTTLGGDNSNPFNRFKLKQDQWQCPSCNVKNDNTKLVCPCCECEKPTIGHSTTIVPAVTSAPVENVNNPFNRFKLKQDQWQCPSCNVKNDNTKLVCPCCEYEKPIGNVATVTAPSGVTFSQTQENFVFNSQEPVKKVPETPTVFRNKASEEASTFSFAPPPAVKSEVVKPLFGEDAKPTSSGLFGDANPAAPSSSLFGGEAKPVSSLFGGGEDAKPTSTLFGGDSKPAAVSSLFGAPTADASAPVSSLFGAPTADASAPVSSLFGAAPALAASAETSSLFGVAPATKPAETSLLFGAAPAAAATSSTLFGAAPVAVPASSSSLFGGEAKPAASSSSLFGGEANPAAPSSSLFGGEAKPAAPSSSLFGGGDAKPAAPTASLFGAPIVTEAKAPSFQFGAAGGSGADQPSFQFGASAAAPVGAEKPMFQFGASAPAAAAGAAPVQFGAPQPTPTPPALFGASQPAAAPASFGAPQSTPTPPALFGGANPSVPSAFGSGFGTAPTTFGGGFGAAPAATPAAPATFGGAFGAPAATPSSSFGFGSAPPPTSPSPAFGFGTSNPPAAVAPAGGGLFGAAPPPSAQFGAPSSASFGFNQQVPPQQFNAAGFGQPMFGQQPQSQFGQQPQSQFGQQPQPQFGQQQPSQQFGQQQQFGAPATPGNQSFSMGNGGDATRKKKIAARPKRG
ncbi:hypothetical protein BASA81_001710 [Batrachochytrium salamandrivorans]|nr:hypothetical protein BASA81_001710 [Batrachochytrium salamandrivorans]